MIKKIRRLGSVPQMLKNVLLIRTTFRCGVWTIICRQRSISACGMLNSCMFNVTCIDFSAHSIVRSDATLRPSLSVRGRIPSMMLYQRGKSSKLVGKLYFMSKCFKPDVLGLSPFVAKPCRLSDWSYLG